MPYELDGNCVKKVSGETVKCHDSHEEAVAHLQALQANVQDSAVVEMSMRITKASYNKSESVPMKWAAIDSDIDEDLYEERMSLELYKSFDENIRNNVPIPEVFREAICEQDWCGGMPYLSIAHYKSGDGRRNVPGEVESVFIDGTRLKSKGTLHDSPLGRKVFDALREDLYMEKKGQADHLPIRISIGFLDLEHKHRSAVGGQEFTFQRTDVGQICPLCAQGVGGKIYTKGHLVHLALTRVPVNPRTSMSVERSMDITSKAEDAKSIVGDLADELETKSISDSLLVVRAEDGSAPVADMGEFDSCYDPNTGAYDQACIDRCIEQYVGKFRKDATVKSTVDKSLLDAVQASVTKLYELNGHKPVVEEAMSKENEVKEPVADEQKSVVGIPEKPFNFAGISGDGNNTLPNPVKSEAEEKEEEDDEMEKAYKALRSRVLEAKSKKQSGEAVQDINELFAGLGTAVEKSFVPQTSTGNQDIAEIVRSAVAQAVQPLAIELATLKSKIGQAPVNDGGVVKSKALTLSGYTRPEDMIQRSVPKQPARKLTQIERLAMKSTGALSE